MGPVLRGLTVYTLYKDRLIHRQTKRQTYAETDRETENQEDGNTFRQIRCRRLSLDVEIGCMLLVSIGLGVTFNVFKVKETA